MQNRNSPSEEESAANIVIKENEIFTDMIVEARSGQELWKVFIILAILFIISELLIIKMIEK